MNKNLFVSLEQALKKDVRFISNDDEQILLKNVIRQAAEQLDETLISLLLEDTKLREVFFKPISDVIVFDSKKFIIFLNNKEFLPDSYTAFKNKVGLSNAKWDYLSDSDEVVLSFPYKDCVLAGWQDKEDTKRQEVFYNEVLGRDEIDRLLDPKTFTNFKKYKSTWEEKLSGFTRGEDGTIKDNLIIKGNNLLALHSLKKEFAGKVKLIYIDPPYNTGSDSFHYNDRFNHSTWLTFMKNRLEVARELLKDDWVIFVQCDDNEQAYLKVLMDQIFKSENFINSIIWKRTFSHWDSGQWAKHLWRLHDTIHLYKKTEQVLLKTLYTPYSETYKNNFYKYDDWDGRKYRLVTMTWPWGASKWNPFYEVLWVERYWMYSKKRMKELIDNWEVIQTKKGNVPQRRRYLDTSPWVPLQDLWLDINPLQWAAHEKTSIAWQKPEKIIERIIEMSTEEGDIVLDFHLGSGTTAAVAHKMNRQYIGVEQMDYIEEIAISRLKKVIKGDNAGISKDIKWKWGGEFVYMELMEANQKYLDKISVAKDTKTLMDIYEEMQKSGFINYYVDIRSIDENISEFEALNLENQKKFLAELLDKNLLYVNHSEIEDVNYWVSDEEKKLNREFYK